MTNKRLKKVGKIKIYCHQPFLRLIVNFPVIAEQKPIILVEEFNYD